MKNLYKICVFTLLLITRITHAQENRTLETKVADILAQYPAKTNEYADQLSQKIVNLGADGIVHFTDMLLPIGEGNDTQVRYALESLARYCAAPGKDATRVLVEKAIFDAIEKAKETEVKTFLIRRLHYCATDASIPAMEKLLSHSKLASPAIGVLTSIGTIKAGDALFSGLNNNPKQVEIIKALGILKYNKALPVLNDLASSTNTVVQKEALFTLSKIANSASLSVLSTAVDKAKYKITDNNAVISYIEYARNLGANGNNKLSKEVCDQIIKNTNSEEQLHLRAAAFSILRSNFGSEVTKSLLEEAKKTSNKKYRQAIFNEASKGMTSNDVKLWLKVLKKLSNEGKGQLLYTLATRKEPEILTKGILPAINDKDILLKQGAIKALVVYQKEKAVPVLAELLKTSKSEELLETIYEALLISLSAEKSNQLVAMFDAYPLASKKITLRLLKEKRAIQHFDFLSNLAKNSHKELQIEAYKAIPNVSSKKDVEELINLLELTNDNEAIENVQAALFSIISNDKAVSKEKELLVKAFESGASKYKLLPVIPAINSKQALEIIKKELNSSDAITKKAAVKALLLCENEEALPYLYDFISSSNDGTEAAFAVYLSKVNTASIPNDQKLLLIRKLEAFVKTEKQTIQIIKASGKIKTFLSLLFVSSYMDQEVFSQTAMKAIISIVLPKPGEKSKFSGKIVREVIEKTIENLKGNDSQYIKIDLKEFLAKMSDQVGYVSIFNEKDLTGWKGLVKNPIERNRMSKHALEKDQKISNKQMLKDWFVKDGILIFKGEGSNNICTTKEYGDIEMLVDWKITKDGDSGIYLRGTPQVQIWDIARTDVGAEVGSGGLYNNKHESTPKVVADNPINEWNTFHIKMIGDVVTVNLNGVLVTDNVVLENYWNKALPLFKKESIELQAHGEDLEFRNIYVREINSDNSGLTKEEKKEGFVSLFNGEHLDYWVGNKTAFLIEDNLLAVRPKLGGHGNLFTALEYSDFIFRFEFQLTPGANNGLGIHAPLLGDAAYLGKELQILDNTAPIYKNLQPYQYHGSVYGIIPAKRGYLKPVGEWNVQEVIVKGDDIKITLNGVVIIDGNVKEASENGTADHKDHPGLKRHKGHIGFLGHGSELQFRNIRIKDLTK